MNYRLTKKADSDVDSIFEYGLTTWGEERAELFLDTLFQRFEWLGNKPEIAKKREELGKEIRCWPHQGYLIFFRSTKESTIDIISVKHQSCDADNQMEDYMNSLS